LTSLHTDVAVIGLGAMGSATLWQLAERGVPAIGFERFQPGHDRGSSHGESRLYRTAYMEGSDYVPLAQHAIRMWRELERLAGDSLLLPIGVLMLGRSDSPVITSTMRSIRIHDLPHTLLDENELRARYPAHWIGAGEVAIHETEAGVVRPERAIRTMAARAENLGAQTLTGITVDRIELRSDGVRVIAGDLTCSARHAVISVGAWLPKVLPELNLPVRVSRQTPGWFSITRPELFAPERFPVFFRDIAELTRPGEAVASDDGFYGFPTLDGRTIKVSIHREGPTTDPDHIDRTVRPDDLERVQECIRLFLHDVDPNPVRTQVCMYENTPDRNFLIGNAKPAGRPPDMRQITILGGFSGHGFKFAPVIGQVAADLATRGGTDHPIGFLSPDRFSLPTVSVSPSPLLRERRLSSEAL
jgi:sarcosine oxidase